MGKLIPVGHFSAKQVGHAFVLRRQPRTNPAPKCEAVDVAPGKGVFFCESFFEEISPKKKRSPQMSQKKKHFRETHVFCATFFLGGGEVYH